METGKGDVSRLTQFFSIKGGGRFFYSHAMAQQNKALARTKEDVMIEVSTQQTTPPPPYATGLKLSNFLMTCWNHM